MKTKKILSIKVTDEHVHDSKMLPELVDEIIDSDNITTIGKLFADGAYEGNEIFRYLWRQWNLAMYQSKKEC